MLIQSYDIMYQEVPNETSLVFFVGGCQCYCKGCHSPWLWEYKGRLPEDIIREAIDKYSGLFTCICFMGGDQYGEEFENLVSNLRACFKVKTCLYTGSELEQVKHLFHCLDYLKVGKYVESLGGLKSPTTNQKFYIIENKEIVREYKFYKE